ncbi:putative ABC-type transporter, periplasmic component [Streptomyces viridiviolaceus]|uniref:MetQ/NlpA family ABC transporter substrate-binding protein n=1 Tax=Streptomyces viridiviolaceus TaxID=68282 RepID=A0ABW2DYH2_9ACTN|nr:MetQ/NlpA family ABC transporter substrate-binding protein [Streptomyces viridiviolaceus]GHB72125.1 putative ABC-type transporter, periplasmic component [Streptomyces viridiviolaceus]
MTNAPTEPGSAPELPDKPRGRRTGLITGIAIGAVAVVAAAAVLISNLTGGTSKADASGRVTVKIGTTDQSSDFWPVLTRRAAEEGIDIKLVNFTDYTQANPALSQKQIDLNLFQHLLFLANHNVANGDNLTPIGSTVVVPLSLYSKKHTAVQEIPEHGRVAIPNDPTNQARALLVLQQAGLLKLKNGGSVLSTPADVDTAASKVTVTPVDASQTVASLPSVDAAVINNNFALDAKLDPSKALYGDDPSKPEAEPYINVFAARSADKNNPTYLKIAKLYHEAAVKKAATDASKGTAVIVDRPQADLEGILASLEKTVRAAH